MDRLGHKPYGTERLINTAATIGKITRHFLSYRMASLPPVNKDRGRRNWAELPPELTSSILHRLGAIEILENAQKVCRSWFRVCKDPSMWRKIDMHHKFGNMKYMRYDLLEKMCRHAVDRSQGGLAEIGIRNFGTDNLLSYIADSSSNLRSLNLAMCDTTSKGIMEAVVKLPLLEDLEISYCTVSEETLKVVGHSCPNLKSFKINCMGVRFPPLVSDDVALAIAETMPGLSFLQLFGNRLTNVGLNAILDNCPNLEHLDLRQCFNLELDGDLEKRCSERIKVVRFPEDSTSDYPYNAIVGDIPSDFSYEFYDEIIEYLDPDFD